MKTWPKRKRLSPEDLGELANEAIEAKDSACARKLRNQFIEGFYGKSIAQLRAEDPVPWLVTSSDLRRYLSRALDACDRGHVVFFFHRHTAQKRDVLMALTPEPNWRGALERAKLSFSAGRYRRLVLAELRPLTSRHRRRKNPTN